MDHALGLHLEVDPARLAELPEKVRIQSELLESFFSQLSKRFLSSADPKAVAARALDQSAG